MTSKSIILSMNIRTLLGDLTGQSFDSSWCLFSGYLALNHVSIMYMAFVNQALYRLVRIIYPRYRYFQNLTFYTFLFIIEYLCIFGIHCVIIAWNGVIYLTNDHFCYVSFTNLLAVMWAAFFAYLFPCSCPMIIYIRITRYLRKQANTVTLVTRQRLDRDFLIVRRISIILGLLLILGIPAMIFILRFAITGDYHPLTLRISWTPVAISIAGLNVASAYCIPQLKSTIRKVFQHRITVISVAVPLGRTEM
ncbi:unnamed protein product [Adineta ricciae]|uniref:G-protein coupled receptors family 1 profile domain-containing protein n=1 Tax=Adineta ricciae TaxID=249248 RepID=A0A815L2G2_ADIRI|nr:unnamed protein product [Adineta ricciae]